MVLFKGVSASLVKSKHMRALWAWRLVPEKIHLTTVKAKLTDTLYVCLPPERPVRHVEEHD